MRKIIELGKIAYTNPKYKRNLVSLEIELKPSNLNPDYLVFTCCGEIWNTSRRDVVCAGQCLDTIAEYINTPLFNKIYKFWKFYHLNDMHVGTIEQEKIVKSKLERFDYDKAVQILTDANMLHDYNCNFDFCGGGIKTDSEGKRYYDYGHGWVYEPIPEEDLKQIKELFNEDYAGN